jgi:hypothetical protein
MIEATTVTAGSARALPEKPMQAAARTKLLKLLVLQEATGRCESGDALGFGEEFVERAAPMGEVWG